jgi:SAM-dependent methyltransferase
MNIEEYVAMAAVEDMHWWFAARKLFIRAFLKDHLQKKLRIVDIGAGTGGTTAWLKKYGTVVGVEPSPHARELAKKRGIILRPGTAEQTRLPARTFDLVTILDVLYHKDVEETKALKEANRLLREGGFLLVTDCALPFLTGPHDRAVFGKRRYMLSEIISLVEDAGFAVRAATYTFFLVFPFTLIHRLLRKHERTGRSDVFMPPKAINAFFFLLSRIEAALIPYIQLPWGSSLLVYAQKR